LATLTRAGAGSLDPEPLDLDPTVAGAADLAAALRACAARDIAGHREASRFGELALDALTVSALELAGPGDAARVTLARYSEERRLAEAAGRFLAEDMAVAFRHFVERDLPAHVGGPRLRAAQDADRLADEVGEICRRTTLGVPLEGVEDDLRRAVERGPEAGHPLYRATLAAALSDSLRALGVAP
jgi:hypothetical protein